jgi:hypothetical protein
MIVFAFVALNPMDTFNQQEAALRNAYTLDFDTTFHFSAGNSIIQEGWENVTSGTSELLYDQLVNVPGVNKVHRFSVGSSSYDTGRDEYNEHADQVERVFAYSNLLVYTKDTLNSINLSLAEELYENDAKDRLPIIVSKSLTEDIPLGTCTEMYIGLSSNAVPCVVVGVLDGHCSIPVVSNYGSSPTLDVLGAFPFISPGTRFIIAAYDEELLSDITWGTSFLIETDKNVDSQSVYQNLKTEMSNLGTISTISELIEKSYDQMINDNRWFAFAFVLLSVIAVFGYGGYLFLVIRQRQSYFSIFFILGITRAKIILINLSVGLILLVLAFAAALYVTPWFMHNLLGISQSTPGLLSILYSCGVLLIVLLVSTIIGFRQAIKSTEFALYQGGD